MSRALFKIAITIVIVLLFVPSIHAEEPSYIQNGDALVAILELASDSDEDVSRLACGLITDETRRKMLNSHVKELKQTMQKKPGSCVRFVLFSGEYRFRSQDRPFLLKLRKKQPILAAQGLADLGIISSIQKQKSGFMHAHLAKNLDELLRKQGQLPPDVFLSAVRRYLLVADLRLNKTTVSERQRTELENAFDASDDFTVRTALMLVLARGATPTQAVKLLNETDVDHGSILREIAKWTPKESWVVPHVTKALNVSFVESGTVSEVVAALDAIREPKYDAYIGYMLRPHLESHEMLIAEFMATLTTGDIWTVDRLGKFFGNHMLRERLGTRCNPALYAKVAEENTEQFFALLYQYQCTDKVETLIAELIVESQSEYWIGIVREKFPRLFKKLVRTSHEFRFLDALFRKDEITDVSPALAESAILFLGSYLDEDLRLATHLLRQTTLGLRELKALDETRSDLILNLFAGRVLPKRFHALRSKTDAVLLLVSAAVDAPDRQIYIDAFFGNFESFEATKEPALFPSVRALCHINRTRMLKAAKRSTDNDVKLAIWTACDASNKDLLSLQKIPVTEKNASSLQDLALRNGDRKTIKAVLRSIVGFRK